MDRIDIRGLRAVGRHGVLDHERADGQTFVVDLSLELDLAEAVARDDLAATVDYGAVVERVAAAVQGTRFDLLEALAGHLADLALADDRVAAVEVRVGKAAPPVATPLEEVAVTLRRERA